jgi:VanZ family protein
VRLTAILLGHKRKFLWLALFWTAIVTVLCLISFDGLPKEEIMSHDKLGHMTFHFGMTSLWFLYLRYGRTLAKGKAAALAFSFSLVYGILIELSQYYFTNTRTGDIRDVAANASGALLACAVIFICSRIFSGNAAKTT